MGKEQDSHSENQPEQNPIQPPRGSERIVYNPTLGLAGAFSAILTGGVTEVAVTVLTGNILIGQFAFIPGAVAGMLVPVALYNRENNRTWRDTWNAWTNW